MVRTEVSHIGAIRLHSSPKMRCEYDPYEELIIAICKLAAHDAKKAKGKNKSEAIWFFRSDWFKFLTGLDGEDILDRLTYWR